MDNTVEEEKKWDESKTFLSLFVESWKTFWSFIRYIFYDVLLGRDAGEIPEAPTKHPVQY